MLQPPQLQEVSRRYPQAIQELRDFLAKAGLPLDTPETLQHVSTLLHQDRTFHRDLTSHVWVAIHAANRQISYPDLLGILTIAAAGPAFAAAADEAEAHDLLRFLMAARGSFEATPPAAPRTPLPWPTSQFVVPPAPAPEPVPLRESRPVRPTEPEAFPAWSTATYSAEEEAVDRRPLILGAIVAALLIALIAVWWHYRSAPASQTAFLATHTSEPTTASTVTTPTPVVTPAPPPPQPVAARSPRHRNPRSTGSVRPSQPAFSPLPPDPAPEDTTASDRHASTPAAPQPAVAREDRIQPAVSAAANTGISAPPPAAARPPTLHPRTSTPTSTPTATTVTHNPTVRPTSLGIMAANVTYSPAPAYPVDASAAHVQGEVKVEAEIDRDGNVTSARVISGPPLLRDATVDAIQRWHYRPYLAAGKPIGMNAIVVVDYELN